MPDFSGIGAGVIEAAGATTASSDGTTISDTGANAKGSYTEIISSTLYPSSWVYITLANPTTGDEYFVDLAVGAAASEQIIVNDLFFTTISSTVSAAGTYLMPLYIPAGSRLSARCQSNSSGADSIDITVHIISGTMMSPSSMGFVTTYGAVTATTTGTNVDPGGTANTKGSYVEFSSSTTYPINWLVIATTLDNAIAANESFLFDISVGGAGSEQVIVPNVFVFAGNGADKTSPQTIALPVSIPAGSRLSARCQCSVNTASERILGLIMYGVS